jgi:hypothetical protein
MLGITPRRVKVLWVDTEQSASHVQRVVKRIYALAGWNDEASYEELRTLSLREIEPKERYNMMVDAVKLFKPKLVVIDGISDLMYNSNCIEESDAVVGQLMALSTEYNCHIMSVLHTNPNSDKARGHIGSTLQRKVETMVYVHKVEERSVVEPQFCRNEPFERFAFNISEEGIPQLCDIPQSEGFGINDRIVDILNREYGGSVERTTLRNKIMEVLSLNRTTALMRIKRLCFSGRLVEDGNLIKCPECHIVTPSQGAPQCETCDNVTEVIPAAHATQASLSLDCPPPRPQYYGHYDEDECPF